MTNSDNSGGNREGDAEAPAAPLVDATVPGGDRHSAQKHQAAADTSSRFAAERRVRARAMPLADDVPHVPAVTRGQADAIIVPIIGTFVGLMAIAAVGLVLMSRKRSKSRAAFVMAALGAAPARWVEGAATAEHRVASDLSGRLSRFRRGYGI